VSGQWTVTELCVHIPALCNLLEDGNRLRFLHQGIQLPDHNTLTDCGIHAGSCIQVSVSHSVPEAPAPAPPQAAAPPPSLDSDDIVGSSSVCLLELFSLLYHPELHDRVDSNVFY
jgi:hypothetical protein